MVAETTVHTQAVAKCTN